MHTIKKSLFYKYFAVRTWWPLWFYVLNYKPRTLWKKNRSPLSPLEQRIVQDLRTYGIATTSLEELFPEGTILKRMQNHIVEREPFAESRTKKDFLKHYWDLNPVLSVKNPFVLASLSKNILGIVNEYMEMASKITYMAPMKTLVAKDSTEISSQAWHRDPEEKKIVKMFIYLNDVDEHTGPFIYIPQTHYTGKWGKLFPQRPPEGSYPSIEDVRKYIPENAIRTMTGKAGTVIFCDTYGLHKGGHATKHERIMYTAFFAAPTSTEPRRFSLPGEEIQALDSTQKYAVTI